MKKAIYISLTFMVFHACTTDEPDPIMLQKKWKMVDTTPLVQESFWITGAEILDFTELSNTSERRADIYIQQTESRNLIKFKNSDAYFEILKLTKENLEIGLCIPNLETKEENRVAVISYQSLDE